MSNDSFLSRLHNSDECKELIDEIVKEIAEQELELPFSKMFRSRFDHHFDDSFRYITTLDNLPEPHRSAFLNGDPEAFNLPEKEVWPERSLKFQLSDEWHFDMDESEEKQSMSPVDPELFNRWAEANGLPMRMEKVFSQERRDAPDDYLDGKKADFFVIEESEFIDELNFNKHKWKYFMENDESKDRIDLHIEAEDGQVEIVRRYGAAEEIHEPKSVVIDGSIEAPGEYYELRKDIIDQDKAHLEVWQHKGKIVLKCDPAAAVGDVQVTGQMQINPVLARMDINKFGQSKRGEDDFVLMLKESRQLFTDQKVCMNLVDKISNIEYKVDKEIKKHDDERGNRKDFYEQHCTAELPETFNLSTNIFVASKDESQEHTFEVELKFHYSAGQLYFWLESPQLQEIKDDVMEQMLGDEINSFAGEIPVIYK